MRGAAGAIALRVSALEREAVKLAYEASENSDIESMRYNVNIKTNKRVLRRLCFVFAGAVFVCPLLFSEDVIHTVKSGETIYGLARDYGVKVEEILFINGIDDARKIQSGQQIRIPVTPAMVPPINPDPKAPAVALHRVQRGETLFGIAHKYNVPLQDIYTVNGFTENYVLKSGDILKIPVAAQSSVQVASGGVPAASAIAAPLTSASAPRSVNLSLIWPISPKQGYYLTGKLSGVALVGERGENVYCVFPGTVISAGPYRGFGRVVIVKSAEGYLYVYGGCENLFVKAGDYVTTGVELGQLGIDSVSEQAALFFMVYFNMSPVDPAAAPRG
jgi:murein DD-endopeptidase MepM/ murein hydrolase activator NlpD